MEDQIKPVRKIVKGRTSLRGTVFSEKSNRNTFFESSLERDFMLIQEFNTYVASYIEQPVEIEYLDDGVKRKYTPDFLVTFRQDFELTRDYKPMLCEIKYRKDLRKDWKDLKKKYKAALSYATAQGWRFKILTEKEIRTPYLENVKFLLPYKRLRFSNIEAVNDVYCNTLNYWIKELVVTTPEELLLCATQDESCKPELLYCLWYMVAGKSVMCDLTIPLTMKSEIWLND